MPTRRRRLTTSMASMSSPSSSTSPSARALRTVSCMRFSVRRKVDLPQPEGPISAVTCFGGMARLTSWSTWLLAVVEVQARDKQLVSHSAPTLGDENQPRRHVGREHQGQQHQAGGPGLAVPVVVGRNRESEDHHRQGGRGLIETRAPVLVAETGEQQRRRLPRHARHAQNRSGEDAPESQPGSPPWPPSATCRRPGPARPRAGIAARRAGTARWCAW